MSIILRKRTDYAGVKILQFGSLGLGLVIVVTCFALYLEHYGFDQGLIAAEQTYGNTINRVEASLHGPRTYEFFANKYKYIALLLLVFLTGKIWEGRSSRGVSALGFVVQAIGAAALGLVLIQLQQIFMQKNIRAQEFFLGEPYDKLLQSSITYDWLFLIGTAILLLIQLINPLFYYFARNSRIK